VVQVCLSPCSILNPSASLRLSLLAALRVLCFRNFTEHRVLVVCLLSHSHFSALILPDHVSPFLRDRNRFSPLPFAISSVNDRQSPVLSGKSTIEFRFRSLPLSRSVTFREFRRMSPALCDSNTSPFPFSVLFLLPMHHWSRRSRQVKTGEVPAARTSYRAELILLDRN